jgi:hypothetical protein
VRASAGIAADAGKREDQPVLAEVAWEKRHALGLTVAQWM